jgi:hypothetical protein
MDSDTRIRLQSKAKTQSELGLEAEECFVADVTSGDLAQAVTGCSAMIIATSATPKLIATSIPWFMFQRFIMREKVMPQFTFPQPPEEVRDAFFSLFF